MAQVLHIIDARSPADMLRQLSLLRRADETVVSVGPAPRHADLPFAAEAVHCPLQAPALAHRRVARRLGQARIVHAWSMPAARAAAAMARTRDLTAVLSLPFRPRGGDLPWCRRAARRGLRVAVPTDAARESMLGAGFEPGSVFVLPPAAEAILDPDSRRTATRSRLGVGAAQCLLVEPEEMIPGAGHKYASWAHAIIRQMLSDVLLLMPGGGPVAERVRVFAGTTGYDDEVFLPGSGVSFADALAAADVVVIPAERDAGVGCLVAAMAAGRPVVATATQQARRIAADGQTALLVPARDPRAVSAALLRLIEDRAFARRLGDQARQAAASYSPGRVRPSLEGVYDAIAPARTVIGC